MSSNKPQPEDLPDFRYPEQVFNKLADLEEEFDNLLQKASVIQERMAAILDERSCINPIAQAYFSKTPNLNVSARTSDGTVQYLVTMKDGAICLCRLLPSYELFKQLADEEVEAIEKKVFASGSPTLEPAPATETENSQTSSAKPAAETQAKQTKSPQKQYTAESGNIWLVSNDGCEARWFDKIVDLSLPWAAAQAKYRDEALEVYDTLAFRIRTGI